MKKQIIGFLNQIINSKASYSRAGGGAGSIIMIKFEDGFCIKTFCDITYHNILLASRNWDFSIPHKNLSFDITKGYKVKKGKYYTSD